MYARYLFCLLAAIVFATPISAQPISATDPTASQNPQIADWLWLHASAPFNATRVKILQDVDHVNQQGPFRADWSSLQAYKIPDWYKDAKFGIFIHWGIYSVPAYGSEWYPRNMYQKNSDIYKHHVATYGTPDKFGYKDFIPLFKADNFNADKWATLFKQSGARYVIPVAEHHDGFAMYDSALSDWTAVKMGPHRDVIGELATAVRKQGLYFGVSSHRVEHDFFFDGGRQIKSDVNDPDYAAFYGPAHLRLENKDNTPTANDFTYVSNAWANDWLARSAELVNKYQPDIIYFDWWIGHPAMRANLSRFAAYYYNYAASKAGFTPVINYKEYAFAEHSAVLDVERGQLDGIRPLHWQSDTSVSNKSWGYIKNDHFKSPQYIIHVLADIVSKNGNLLLNIGPRADGTIPDEAKNILLEVGAWLKTNGEAIYGTHPWKIYGEGPVKSVAGAFHEGEAKPYTAQDFRFTMKDGVLYAIELGWPANGETVVHALATGGKYEKKIGLVSLLGSNEQIQFSQKNDGLHIKLPQHAPGKYAYVFKIV